MKSDNILSLAMRASVWLIWTVAGLGFAPRPSVIYPVRPEKAPIALEPAELVTGRGVEISVAVIEEMEKIAYSVGEYAKHAVSWFINEIMRAECGKGASYKVRV